MTQGHHHPTPSSHLAPEVIMGLEEQISPALWEEEVILDISLCLVTQRLFSNWPEAAETRKPSILGCFHKCKDHPQSHAGVAERESQ